MDFLNRMGWLMGTLAGVAALSAVGVGVHGYLTTPRPAPPAPPQAAAPAARPEGDPLAPRLLDRGRPVRVHVAGAVRKPGVYSLPAWARVVDAMKEAGGPTGSADLDGINLADPIRDGEQIRIPVRGRRERLNAHQPTPEPPYVPPTVGGRARGRYPFAAPAPPPMPAVSPGPATAPVNLNSATPEQLEALPGIGPATAEKVIAYREERGGFRQPEDLLNVSGIGPRKLERLRALIQAP